MKKLLVGLCATCLLVSTLQATTVTLKFNRITSNCSDNVAGQLFVDVIENGADVEFKFRNEGPVASSISEVYFYDGVLLNMYTIDDSCTGVDFENLGDKTNPKSLPGYNPDKDLLEVLSATEAERPEPANGVKPGEWLSIGYTLLADFQTLLDNIDNGEVVIGIHVKAINCDPDDPLASTQSDSFINDHLPEPTTVLLLGLGGLLLRKKRRA